jgi:hypothetical protein
MKQVWTIAVVILLAFLSPASGFAQGEAGAHVFILIPGARAYGMGETGVADPSDPANVYFNPGVISSIEGLFFTGGYGQLVPDLASDVWTMNAGAGGGFQIMSSGDEIKIRAGGGIRFGWLDYGTWEARDGRYGYLGVFSSSERYLSVTLGGGIGFRNILYFGAGASVKPVWIDLAPAAATPHRQPGNGSGVAFDAGLLAMVDVPGLPGGARIMPSIGLSFLNLGRSITFIDPDQAAPLPKNYRVGIGVRVESPSLKEIDDMLGTRIPIGTVSVSYDIIDNRLNREERCVAYDSALIHCIASEKPKSFDNWGLGAEFAILQALFLRYGYVYDEDGNIKGSTYGLGLGLKLKMIWGRIDIASVPQARELDRVQKYGLSCGVTF